MSEMHEATPVSQPFPHFERLVDSRGKLWRFRTSDLDAWVHLRLKLASYPYRP